MYADVVEGTIAAREGRVARRLLGPLGSATGNHGEMTRRSLAEVEWEQGNVAEAVSYLSANLYDYSRTQAVYTLARIHDERGDAEQARAYYRRFLTITREGDQDLPEIVQAREAWERLTR